MVELMKKPQIKWTDEKKNYLIENYAYGNSDEMVKYIGCTKKALKSMARLMGLKSLKDKNNYKLLPLITDTPYNYYWWGYIIADGYISKKGQLSITTHIKDHSHLEILSNYLSIEIKKGDKTTIYGTGTYSYITCQDAIYGNILKNKIGITENKTYKCIDYNWIDTPDKFISFFIGFFDGDGTMSFYPNTFNYSVIKIECHYNWLNFLNFCKQSLLKYFNIESTVYVTTRGYSAIRIYKTENIEKIYKESLKLNLPILKRKWISNN